MQRIVQLAGVRGVMTTLASAGVSEGVKAMEQMVFVVDDDDAVRTGVVSLLSADGYSVRDFASAAAFYEAAIPALPTCLILDMRMPEICGLEVVDKLMQKGNAIPVIFMTGFGSIPLSVQAIKAGAVEFLTKPVPPDELLRAVREALAIDTANCSGRLELAKLYLGYDSLTPRERETMELVIGGLLNKQVADELGVSEIMAKRHKRKVMEKMHARSLPDLVRSAERLHIVKTRSR
jgi:FixJ family two-component response regulator